MTLLHQNVSVKAARRFQFRLFKPSQLHTHKSSDIVLASWLHGFLVLVRNLPQRHSARSLPYLPVLLGGLHLLNEIVNDAEFGDHVFAGALVVQGQGPAAAHLSQRSAGAAHHQRVSALQLLPCQRTSEVRIRIKVATFSLFVFIGTRSIQKQKRTSNLEFFVARKRFYAQDWLVYRLPLNGKHCFSPRAF